MLLLLCDLQHITELLSASVFSSVRYRFIYHIYTAVFVCLGKCRLMEAQKGTREMRAALTGHIF